MSITFWIPEAPTEKVQPYPDEPDYFETVPLAPFFEVNMTAGNANAILALVMPEAVNPEEDPYGTWGREELSKVRQAAMIALATRRKEIAYLDPFISQEPGRCKVFSGGRDEEYVTRRLQELMRLAEVAMAHDYTVSFG